MSAVAPSSASSLTTQTSAGKAAIRLLGLTKRFPARRSWSEALRNPLQRRWTPALQEVTCTIEEGEFFGLLGPNGAGKTTLFKLLATLVLPDAGSATVCGYDVVREARRARSILAPVITDDRSLYWRLSARENLELYARLQDLPAGGASRRVDELLEVVGLVESGRKMVGAFSSGMKQRLLIARALLARPRILLLDEPTRSLDPLSARSLRSFLREEISGRQGCTVLLATHNTEEALELCGRVAVLHDGRLLAMGTPAGLLRETEERYRLWIRGSAQGSLAVLEREGVIGEIAVQPEEEDGWSCIEMNVRGGLDGAARVLAGLGRAGGSVGRFERIPKSLADLIEGIIERRRQGLPHG